MLTIINKLSFLHFITDRLLVLNRAAAHAFIITYVILQEIFKLCSIIFDFVLKLSHSALNYIFTPFGYLANYNEQTYRDRTTLRHHFDPSDERVEHFLRQTKLQHYLSHLHYSNSRINPLLFWKIQNSQFCTRNFALGPLGMFVSHMYRSFFLRPSNIITLLQFFISAISLMTASVFDLCIFGSDLWCGIIFFKSSIRWRCMYPMPRDANTSTRCLFVHFTYTPGGNNFPWKFKVNVFVTFFEGGSSDERTAGGRSSLRSCFSSFLLEDRFTILNNDIVCTRAIWKPHNQQYFVNQCNQPNDLFENLKMFLLLAIYYYFLYIKYSHTREDMSTKIWIEICNIKIIYRSFQNIFHLQDFSNMLHGIL